MPHDDLSGPIGFRRLYKLRIDIGRRIKHGEFAVLHLNDIDSPFRDCRAEAEAGKQVRLERKTLVRKGGNFFVLT